MKHHLQKTERFIVKYSDKQKLFSSQKLNKSLRKAGADTGLVRGITREIEKMQSISNTKDIHNYAFQYLKRKNNGRT